MFLYFCFTFKIDVIMFKKILNEIKLNGLEYVILFIVLYIAYFYQLGAANIRTWDEGVYGSNVLEMMHRKDFLVKYFNGHLETWATIPPFIAWFQVLSFYIFGISEFTFRLPSAIAAIIISISIFYFLYKEFNDKYWSFFAVLILALSDGFVTYHVARTGDLDIFVTLFSILYTLTFYRFYKSDFKSKKLAILFILFIFCAFWSKLVAGFFFLPVIFVYIFLSGKVRLFFQNKWLYVSAGVLLILTVMYYLYMETKVAGYTKIAIHNGIIGRFTGTLSDNHIEPFWFYWNNMKSNRFIPWLFILPLSIVLMFKNNNKEQKKFIFYLLSLIMFYFLVISSSANKLMWYDAQIYPLLSILVAYPFSIIFSYLTSFYKTNAFLKQLLFVVFFIAFMGIPFIERENKSLSERHLYDFDESYGTALKAIYKKYPQIKKITILHPYFSPHVTYYQTLYNLYHNYTITDQLIADYIDIKPQSYILYGHQAVTEKLKNFFDYEILYEYKDVKLIHVKNQIKYIAEEYHIDGDSLLGSPNIITKDYKTSGEFSIKINKNNPFSPNWDFCLTTLRQELYSKFQLTGDFLMKNNLFDCYFVIESNELNYWNGINLKTFSTKPNFWNKIDTIIDFPKFENWQNPTVRLYFWNNKEQDLFIDNVVLKLLK